MLMTMMKMKMTILEKITMMMLKMLLLLAIAYNVDIDVERCKYCCYCLLHTHSDRQICIMLEILGYKCQTHTLDI